MITNKRRLERSAEEPMTTLPASLPGILAAMALSEPLEIHLRGLAEALLVTPYSGSTMSRFERELIATAVSASNDCFFCTDSHAAFARELANPGQDEVVDQMLNGQDPSDPKMRALLDIARTVSTNARSLDQNKVAAATALGATDGDVQLTILIASAFSMYNRMVDGLRAPTPVDLTHLAGRAVQIAEHGYINAPTSAAA